MGTGVEKHWAAEVRDLQRGEILLPAAEPISPAAVQDKDIDLPILAAAYRCTVIPVGNKSLWSFFSFVL